MSIKSMSFDKEEIQLMHFTQSNVTVLHLDLFCLIVLALVIGIIFFIGMSIKGLFLYYAKFKAPKNRPFNRMIFIDQVMTYLQSYSYCHYCSFQNIKYDSDLERS